MGKFIDMDKLVLPKGTVDKIQKKGVPAILDWLAEQDSIDIVRCENCKHLIEIDKDNLYVCDRIDIGMDGEPSFLKPETDFCSYGERKETE